MPVIEFFGYRYFFLKTLQKSDLVFVTNNVQHNIENIYILKN